MPALQRMTGFIIYTGRLKSIVPDISFDNNRKITDVSPFHPAATHQAKWELWKNEHLSISSLHLCLTNSATLQLKHTPNTRWDYLSISNYSVFSKVATAEKEEPVMLPLSDGSSVKLSLLLPVPLQLPAADWLNSCHSMWIWIGPLHTGWGSHLSHWPSKWLRSDKARYWHLLR